MQRAGSGGQGAGGKNPLRAQSTEHRGRGEELGAEGRVQGARIRSGRRAHSTGEEARSGGQRAGGKKSCRSFRS